MPQIARQILIRENVTLVVVVKILQNGILHSFIRNNYRTRLAAFMQKKIEYGGSCTHRYLQVECSRSR